MNQLNQLKQLYAKLTVRQRIIIGVAAVAVITGLVFVTRWNKERNFKPLFTNLAAEDAGQVVAKIRESAVEYRLAENGTSILVPSSKVAELRLQLASAGLPKTGRIGFELFDKTNFGATDFTEQVNYHRALEGELERSIMSLAEVEQARVHITFPKDSIYIENRQPAKASVLLKLKLGSRLSPPNVLAICKLTASAVEGLAPELVSVLDMNGNLLALPKKPGSPDSPEPDEAALEYRRKIERDLAAKLHSTLEPLLGADKYRAGLSVECDFTSGEQSEEVFDPNKSVMVNSQRTEDGSATTTISGVPGTASNLPRPTSRPYISPGAPTNRKTENISYQSSRLVKRLKLPQGNIKRISVSVVLDQGVRWEKGQRIFDAPSPEKLKVVKDLVSGVVGFQAERGDQVFVETLPFDATLKIPPPPPPVQPQAPGAKPGGPPPAGGGFSFWGMLTAIWAWLTAATAWLMTLIKKGNPKILIGSAVGVLLLVAGATWLFLRMRKAKKKKAAELAAKELEAKAKAEAQAAITAPNLEKEMEAKMAEQAALKEQQTIEVLNSLRLPPVKTKKAEVIIKHLGQEAKKDPLALALVVRTWLNTSDNES